MNRSITKSIRAVAAGICLVVLCSSSLWALVRPGTTPAKSTMIPGKITIQFETNVNTNRVARGFGAVSTGIASLDQILLTYEATDARPIFEGATRPAVNSGLGDLTRFYEVSFPDSIPVETVVKAFLQNPNIRVAEPVWYYTIDATPNDPQLAGQWDFNPPGPDPEVYNAWNSETGSDSIKIAVVDTGVLYKHPDLTGNIWVNPGEDINHNGVVWDIDDLNGIDDDGNGFVDDLIGWDFVSSSDSLAVGEDGFSPDNDPADFGGHGTHCSGTIAAMNNNGVNIASMAGGWYGGSRSFRGSRIIPCRAGSYKVSGNASLASNALAAAVNYATLVHANVINASWGGGSFSAPLSVAITNAIASGISFCHSAGNSNSDVEGWQDQIPGVLTVAATTSTDGKASFSNYGDWITVSAPGESILSTVSNSYTPGTAYYDGTSMAAPHVAGLSALIRSMMPSLTRAQVDSILVNTTDNIDGINPTYAGMLGTGRINAKKALQNLANAKFTANVTAGNVPLAVNFTDNSPNSPTTWDWDLGDGTLTSVQNPSHTYTAPGMYSVHLKVNDIHGLGEEHLHDYMWVRADTLKIDSIMVSPGSKAVMNVYYRNSELIQHMQFPFMLSNSEGISLDSISVVGCRTATFGSVVEDAAAPGPEIYSVAFTAAPFGHYNYMAPGSGSILKLYLNIPSTATGGAVVDVDTMTQGFGDSKKPIMTSIWGQFWPVYKPGKIVVRSCLRGKVLCGPPPVNLVDLSLLVSYLTSGTPTPDPYGGNINSVGGIDLSDLSYLVAYLTGSGPAPTPN
jgi:subtilisin family serine protease